MTGTLTTGPNGLTQYEGTLVTFSHVTHSVPLTGSFEIGDSVTQTVDERVISAKIANITYDDPETKVSGKMNIDFPDGNLILTMNTSTYLVKLDNSVYANIDAISTNSYTNVASLSLGNSEIKSTNTSLTITSPTDNTKIEWSNKLVNDYSNISYVNTHSNTLGIFITNNFFSSSSNSISVAYSNSTVTQNVSINTTSISISNTTVNFVLNKPSAEQVTDGFYYYAPNNTWAAAGKGYVSVGTANQVAYYSAAGNTVAGTNKIVIYDANVGINTPTPVYTLNVNGYFGANGLALRGGTTGDFQGGFFNFYRPDDSHTWLYIADQHVATINNTSDYRYKVNILNLDRSIDKVMKMRPVSFNWKNSVVKERVDGFIAHELQEVIPSSVFYEKDAVTKDGEIQPQTIDLLPVISVLTKAIQDLKEEFDEYRKSHP